MLEPELRQAMADVLGLDPEDIGPETGRDTVSDWDSVGHLRLILEVERTFGVRFPAAEIPELTSAARIHQAIQEARTASS